MNARAFYAAVMAVPLVLCNVTDGYCKVLTDASVTQADASAAWIDPFTAALGNATASTGEFWQEPSFAAFAASPMQGGTPAITLSSAVPNELNPPWDPNTPASGGAPNATPAQAAAFAWQEFIAMNWPAGPQQGKPGQRDTPSTSVHFGDPSYTGPLVWETLRGKVEIFPGGEDQFKYLAPPGYKKKQDDPSLGYDALPQYRYTSNIPSCSASQVNDETPWVNLDETDQITLDNMYAGVVAPTSSPGNSSPQLIRFLAKANRTQYVYVAGNSSTPDNPDSARQWWNRIPRDVVTATKTYLATQKMSPPAGSSSMVSLPYGTIEVKAGWRPLNPSEATSGRFHVQRVRFYENIGGSQTAKCYRDADWGLVALHIIQKTPSAPYFIYATFEQADNILTADGKPVEDANGNVIMPTGAPTAPQTCLIDPRPSIAPTPAASEITSTLGSVVLTANPNTCKPLLGAGYCGAPGSQLYYRNAVGMPPNSEPSAGNVCVNSRENPIPSYAIDANTSAHAAIATYLRQNGIRSAPWLYYKLINVQYYPFDKIISAVMQNGSLYNSKPPYTAQNPAPSSFYQANIVVETNRSLQLFSGGLTPYITTDWNQDGSAHANTVYGGHLFNMGGCMGCHGSQGQNPKGQAGDFSVILARGNVGLPEAPSIPTSQGMTPEVRNRSLTP
jgi:hypothetical protein